MLVPRRAGIVGEVSRPRFYTVKMNELKPIDSDDALLEVLREELGYCACAYEDAVPVLREILAHVVRRSDSVTSHDVFSIASRALEEYMFSQASSGMTSWMVFALENAGLLFHGGHVLDLWITDRGRWLCAAMERFPNPQPGFARAS